MSPDLLLLFCRKELRDLRTNRKLWPGYLILPVLAVALPVGLILLIPVLLMEVNDPGVRMLIDTLERDLTIPGSSLAERLGRLLLRDLGLWYLLMPVILASGPAALAMVREKEQRTLEPILATPLSDRALVLSKLVGAIGPAIMWTWITAIAGFGIGALVTALRLGVAIGPTPGNIVGVLVLGPVLTGAAALGAIAASARFADSQSAHVFTGLVIVPATLIVLGLAGRPAMASAWLGLGAAAVLVLVGFGLYRRAVRRLRREELLTSWK